MCGQHFLLIFCFLVCAEIHAESDYELQQANGTEIIHESSNETSLTSFEHVLGMIEKLTAAQKLVWEQQSAHQHYTIVKNREEQAMQEKMFNELKNEQHLLKEMFGTLKRSVKRISSKGSTTNSARNQDSELLRPKDCAELYVDGKEQSGVYKVWPTWSKDKTGFYVYCDMDTDGGGWTVIHRWGVSASPATFFHKSWEEYKNGFGDLNTAFWLGNTQIYELTNQGTYELRFDLNDISDETYVYWAFWIDSESRRFELHVQDFIGTGEDIFSVHHGAGFSTIDSDGTGGYNCASKQRRPGWWFKSDCTLDVNLYSSNSRYSTEKEMKIRPTYFQTMKEKH